MATTLETDIASPGTEIEQSLVELGPWFHNLHLPDGTQTAPNHRLGDFPAVKWREIAGHLPEDLSGWTALDIGCNAGFYCFELAKRGATVTGIDVEERYLRQAKWARGRFGFHRTVSFKRMTVYDLARTSDTFDLVFFLGVLYHLRYPLLALDLVARRVRRRMIFQSMTMPGEGAIDSRADYDFAQREVFMDPGWPKMAFVEEKFAGDFTNWWVPNHNAVAAMLRSSGMRITARPSHDVYVCEPDPSRSVYAQEYISAELCAATGISL